MGGRRDEYEVGLVGEDKAEVATYRSHRNCGIVADEGNGGGASGDAMGVLQRQLEVAEANLADARVQCAWELDDVRAARDALSATVRNRDATIGRLEEGLRVSGVDQQRLETEVSMARESMTLIRTSFCSASMGINDGLGTSIVDSVNHFLNDLFGRMRMDLKVDNISSTGCLGGDNGGVGPSSPGAREG